MPDRPFCIFALVWPIQMVKIIWRKNRPAHHDDLGNLPKTCSIRLSSFQKTGPPRKLHANKLLCWPTVTNWPSSINCRRIGGRRKEEAGGETSYVVQVRFLIDEIFRLLMDVWVLQFFIVSGQVLEISDILLFRFAHFEKKNLLCSGLQGSSKAWCSLCDRCLWIRW